MPLKAAPVWALRGPEKPRPESWGVRVDVTNLSTAGLTKMYIYGEIGYWGVEALDVIEALRDISGPVEVHINSMGGSVWEGLAIYQALREHPHNVSVVIDGLAASAASFIAMAGTTIEIGAAAHMMIHNAASYCSGDADAFEAQATMLRNCTQAIAGLYAKRTGGDVEDFVAAMAAETWYIGQQAVDIGLADSVRGEDTEEPEFPANATTMPVFNLTKLADPAKVVSPGKPADDQPKLLIAMNALGVGSTILDALAERQTTVTGQIDGWAVVDYADDTTKNSPPSGGLFDHIPVVGAGLFDHLTEGAAQ